MKELQNITDKIVTLKSADSEVGAFFEFIADYFFKELPRACDAINMKEVEKKMGHHFNIIMTVMFDCFLSTHCKSVKGIWNVLDIMIKKRLLSEEETVFAKALRDSYLGLYKIKIIKRQLILEDLVDYGEKLEIHSAPDYLLTVPKDTASALRVVRYNKKLIVTQGFLAFPIKIAVNNLAPLIQAMSKKSYIEENDCNMNKLSKFQQKLVEKKMWALEMTLYYAALNFGIKKSNKNITFH